VAVGLTDELGRLLGGEVRDLERLLGGASRETWAFTLDGRPLVLRRDPPGAPRGGVMEREAVLLRAAAAAGVPVPDVLAASDDPAGLGAPWLVMARLDGETIARRILRDEQYAGARSRLIGQLASAVAALHRGVGTGDVPGLPVEDDVLAAMRATLDAATEPHPALELGLRRLTGTRPATTRRSVVHGDFRLGNVMVGPDGLVGVLDWELAHVGDPAEDLGWLCVPSWRFGGLQPVAGIGTREELLSTYAAAGGSAVDLPTLAWWEAYGTLRWGVICVQQAAAHLTGAVRSVELATIGRRVCEVELDLLDQLYGPADIEPDPPPLTPSGPHDRPTALELLQAVREWVGTLPLDGRDAFLARVVSRALETVGRETVLGPALAERHRLRLAALGMASDADLAGAIRNGDDRPELVAAVRAAVVDKLRVADPALLRRRDQPPLG
jgi:aminoglycoside phosphotransferase (APT) family kinase protein